MSVNALVNSILSKFEDWDRFADRYRFVPVTSDLLVAFLSNVSDEEIEKIANTLGPNIVDEGMGFWRKETICESLITYLSNRCRYASYGNLLHETKGKSHLLVIEHDLGRKWSIYLHNTIGEVLRKFGIDARFEISENKITIRFRNASSQCSAYTHRKEIS